MDTLSEVTSNISKVDSHGIGHTTLTIEDIERLLEEAEVRLRSAEELKTSQLESDISITKLKPLPKLSAQLPRELYVQKKDGIAIADSARLVDRDQRRLADQEHYVESFEKSKKAVSRIPLLRSSARFRKESNMMITLSKYSNCRPARFILNCPAPMRNHIIQS